MCLSGKEIGKRDLNKGYADMKNYSESSKGERIPKFQECPDLNKRKLKKLFDYIFDKYPWERALYKVDLLERNFYETKTGSCISL